LLQRGTDEAAFAVVVFAAERFHHAAEIAEAAPLERGGKMETEFVQWCRNYDKYLSELHRVVEQMSGAMKREVTVP
jgi:hypothetical protein